MTDTVPLWTFDALLAASSGGLDGAAPDAVTGISIDTRSLAPGDLFVALTDARDGHDFVPAAFARGASAALVRRDYQRQPADAALIRVDDPLVALRRIGDAARRRLAPGARRIALTGSAGKTGTKEMLRACLAPLGRTHAPEKSFNNHWGVPLTLARMPADTQFAVFEIGMNHAGEITPLSELVAPHIAVVTNVLPVHIGNFPDGEVGIAGAKAEILVGLVDGGAAVLPRDSAHFRVLEASAKRAKARILTFGAGQKSEIRLARLEDGEAGSEVTVQVKGRSVDYVVGAPGRHLAMNSLAVVAVLDSLDLDLADSLAPLAAIRAPTGRGARETIALPGGQLLLIDESYNANPASMRAALATLATVSRQAHPRRIAILGDMRELGAQAPAFHIALQEAVDASGADLVFACGEHMSHLFERIPASRRGGWAATSHELVPAVAAALAPGDAVMIKGSLGTNMAPLVAAVRSLAGTAG
jgi:UDP-N-acetylmuramoyl-tripeptide--D-alanyl-D-alanine ligase